MAFILDSCSFHYANTYGVNPKFRFIEGVWLHRKSRQFRHVFRKIPILHHTCATCSELTSHISTMTETILVEDK